MPEIPSVQADLLQPGSPPLAEDPAAAGASAVVAPAPAAGQPAPSRPEAVPACDLALFQPWLLAIRQERRIAQALAPALTARLLAAYIDRYLLTPEAPSRASLESALGAQRPDLLRHLSAWMRRRPSPTLQDALWQGLSQWLHPRLQAWILQDLAATPGAEIGAALTPAAWALLSMGLPVATGVTAWCTNSGLSGWGGLSCWRIWRKRRSFWRSSWVRCGRSRTWLRVSSTSVVSWRSMVSTASKGQVVCCT